jgi:hypothetical protein
MHEAIVTLVTHERIDSEFVPYTKVYRVEFDTAEALLAFQTAVHELESQQGVLNVEQLHASGERQE